MVNELVSNYTYTYTYALRIHINETPTENFETVRNRLVK